MLNQFFAVLAGLLILFGGLSACSGISSGGSALITPANNNDSNDESSEESIAVKILPGYGFNAIWRSDNTLWGIGQNTMNEFGHDLTDSISDWIQITSNITEAWGFYSTLVIRTSEGRLLAAGFNDWGQLDNGETNLYVEPVTTFTDVIVSGDVVSNVTDVFIGLYNMYAIVGGMADF